MLSPPVTIVRAHSVGCWGQKLDFCGWRNVWEGGEQKAESVIRKVLEVSTSVLSH